MGDGFTLGLAILGAVTGVIGTILSVLSMLREMDRDKVKLRVAPNHAFPVGHDGQIQYSTMTLEITNLSAFPVTLSQIGFRDRQSTGNLFCFDMVAVDGGPVMRRLEPRTAVSVMFPPEFIHDPKFARVRCAFVRTACGETVECMNGALQQMVASAAKQG